MSKVYRVPYSIKLATQEDRKWAKENITRIRAFIESQGGSEIKRQLEKTEERKHAKPRELFIQYENKVDHPTRLYDMFTCPETKQAAMIGGLPCVEAMIKNESSDKSLSFECRNATCQQNLRRRLGIK